MCVFSVSLYTRLWKFINVQRGGGGWGLYSEPPPSPPPGTGTGTYNNRIKYMF